MISAAFMQAAMNQLDSPRTGPPAGEDEPTDPTPPEVSAPMHHTPPLNDAVLLIGPTSARHGLPVDPDTVRTTRWKVPGGYEPLNTLCLDHQEVPELAPDTAPLFALVPTLEGWRPYTRVSYSIQQSLMLALGGRALPIDEPFDIRPWLPELFERHQQIAPHATNHQCWFVNAAPGQEIEHKFTLSGQPAIWPLAVNALEILTRGGIPGWVPEYGNNFGFEEWDFPTHVYACDNPPRHVAYIPAVDGTWIIREKWGDPDTPRIRAEELTAGVQLGEDPDLQAAACEQLGAAPDWHGDYRRIRFNVMLESPRTGHIFSVMFDRCIDLNGQVPNLSQVEVEYVRSRTPRRPPVLDGLMGQFDELIAWTRSYLEQAGVPALEDNLSKVSWLRSTAGAAAAADQPP